MLVGEVNQLAELVLGEKGEGTACELKAIDVVAHPVVLHPAAVSSG